MNYLFILYLLKLLGLILLYLSASICLIFGLFIYKWIYDGYKNIKKFEIKAKNKTMSLYEYLGEDLTSVTFAALFIFIGIILYYLFYICFNLV